MLSKVGLTRFRGFKELVVTCTPVTAFIGRNSSGKTTLLSAVRLACEALSLALEADDRRPEIKESGEILVVSKLPIHDGSRLIALADWRQIFPDAVVSDEAIRIALEFTHGPVRALVVELQHNNSSQLLLSVELLSEEVTQAMEGVSRPRSPQYASRLREALLRSAPIALLVPPFYGVTRLEEYRTLPIVRRMLSGGDQSHIVRNLVARLDGQALERLNRFLGDALSVRLEHRTPQQDVERVAELVVTYRDTNGALELSSAGAGLVSLVALYAAMEQTRQERSLERDRAIMFLLDEPEAHLHPRLQGDIGDAVVRLATEFNVQLLLATHSVEMINRIGRRADALIWSVDRTTSTAIALRSDDEILAALDEFCDLTPFTSLSFLASRRVLFHEGVSDYKLLDALARVYYATNDSMLARWRAYVPVALDGVGNVSARGVLQRVLTPKLFPRIGKGDAVRAALARDRDYAQEFQAPTVEKTADTFEAITAVWSRNCIESLFLDREVLAAWLSPVLGMDLGALRPIVDQAIAAADADRALEDEAVDGLAAVLGRPTRGEDSMLTPKAVKQRARAAARGEPAVWQPGRRRASFMLEKIRRALPGPLSNRLRGSIVDVIARADTNRLGDPTVLIPQEVRAFLDLLVATRPS